MNNNDRKVTNDFTKTTAKIHLLAVLAAKLR